MVLPVLQEWEYGKSPLAFAGFPVPVLLVVSAGPSGTLGVWGNSFRQVVPDLPAALPPDDDFVSIDAPLWEHAHGANPANLIPCPAKPREPILPIGPGRLHQRYFSKANPKKRKLLKVWMRQNRANPTACHSPTQTPSNLLLREGNREDAIVLQIGPGRLDQRYFLKPIPK